LELIQGKKSPVRSQAANTRLKIPCYRAGNRNFSNAPGDLGTVRKDLQDKDARIAELERLVGRLTMQASFQKSEELCPSSLIKNREQS